MIADFQLHAYMYAKARLLMLICHQTEGSLAESQYINMIGKKTAALFEVSCALGALSAIDTTRKMLKIYASFGRNVGIAFQLLMI